ncbi:MAG: hypothetical protein QN141_13215 [Armatimonadota bacterium]|nr:hypothetical protein [Armatimonadota bacterium]MDR7452413.1 hypothetical protein [Armatimonadota bacterium]MDR7468096.1 hypothetical protein [Armatimonadota bacterium]MDR7494666.1 hypothetical protein [Armatimonadota bacterium]MDR7500201.1 hypothetical protein [Armatimonadota bacterium]
MVVRAARPRGIRRRPRERGEVLALRELTLRIARRAFQTWLRHVGPRRYRLISGRGE